MPPLILTLTMDRCSSGVLNTLRREHFPPERNFLSAHITLFHALPGEWQSSIADTLRSICGTTPVMRLSFPQLRLLGRGVAVDVHCPELLDLRARLAAAWSVWLTPQDRLLLRPHITIQNKVAAETARLLFERLHRDWQMADGQGEALALWHYLGGPWELASEFPFRSLGPP